MNTILSLKKGDPGKRRILSEIFREHLNTNHHEINITDGGEFLDDAIRTKDQPLGATTVTGMNNLLPRL